MAGGKKPASGVWRFAASLRPLLNGQGSSNPTLKKQRKLEMQLAHLLTVLVALHLSANCQASS
jgi:hypothetical protein